MKNQFKVLETRPPVDSEIAQIFKRFEDADLVRLATQLVKAVKRRNKPLAPKIVNPLVKVVNDLCDRIAAGDDHELNAALDACVASRKPRRKRQAA